MWSNRYIIKHVLIWKCETTSRSISTVKYIRLQTHLDAHILCVYVCSILLKNTQYSSERVNGNESVELITFQWYYVCTKYRYFAKHLLLIYHKNVPTADIVHMRIQFSTICRISLMFYVWIRCSHVHKYPPTSDIIPSIANAKIHSYGKIMRLVDGSMGRDWACTWHIFHWSEYKIS